jgi:alkylated DNA repair dioxygenase AlkB
MDSQQKRPKLFLLGIDGLELYDEFVTMEEEQTLLKHIYACDWNKSLKRNTIHFGFIYDYANKDAAQTAPPIPEWCDFLVNRLLETERIKERPDQLIINEYQPGQGIAPHIDNTRNFADGIVSISLGADIIMDFTMGEKKREKMLHRRSALVLHGDARYKWKHGITARKKDNGSDRGTRVSLTFRKMN